MAPSGDDQPGKTPAAPKPRRGGKRKPGKQPGAPGAYLAWTDHPDRTEDLFPSGSCECGTDLKDATDLGVVSDLIQIVGTGGIHGCGALGLRRGGLVHDQSEEHERDHVDARAVRAQLSHLYQLGVDQVNNETGSHDHLGQAGLVHASAWDRHALGEQTAVMKA